MNQDNLPRLPIPPLAETLERFNKTIEPLLPIQQQREEANRVIQNFLDHDGPVLQKLLEQHDNSGARDANNTISSYIEEFWSDAYLAPDTSVVLNLNPFFLLEEDPDAKIAKDQILRAASLTFQSLKFAASLKNETVPPDTIRGVALCMDQFHALFGGSRIPKVGQKDVVEVDPESKHVAVLFRNQFYYFQGLWPSVMDEDGQGDGDGSVEVIDTEATVAVDQSDIAQILRSIVEDGSKTSVEDSSVTALGGLTSLPRESWANAREILVQTSEHNSTALAIIDSALFVLVLDEFVPADVHEAAANMLHGTHAMSSIQSTANELNSHAAKKSLAKEYQVGTCCNRWYDKLQIIVCSDGSAGVNFEHSAIDGHTALRFVSDVYAETVVTFAKSITKSIYTSGCPIPTIIDAKLMRVALLAKQESDGNPLLDTNPKKLVFDVTEKMKDTIFYAETSLGDALHSDDTCVLEFQNFGKTLIVKNKLSPDSVVQMSILLGYYTLYGEIVCAYEPVLTKRFLHGRTEAMRSTTSEATELCAIWTNRASSNEQKMEALRKATRQHSKLVKDASQGKGVDRHLYALQCIAEKNNLQVPELFQSKAWKTLNRTVLSTSNCGNPALRLFGFGPVIPDGFGIGYIIKDNGIQYSISSKHRQTRRFAKTIQQTLIEIGQMLEPLTPQAMGYHRVDDPFKKAEKRKVESKFNQASTEKPNSMTDAKNISNPKKNFKACRRPRRTSSVSTFVGRTFRRQTSLKVQVINKAGSNINKK